MFNGQFRQPTGAHHRLCHHAFCIRWRHPQPKSSWECPKPRTSYQQRPAINTINTINPNNTNEQSGDTSVLEGTQRLVFDATIGAQIASKLPTGKSIAIMAVGSSTDWNIADQYARYLKAKGFDVSFSRTSETVPPADHKIIIRDDPGISPIIVIIDPSAL